MDTLNLAPQLPSEPVFRLPEWRTPIIGRAPEVAVVEEFVRNGESWLVTITGPGGVGKSRLAHEVATRLSLGFDENVAWIPLAPASTTERAIETLAHVLGISRPGLTPEQAVANSLAGRRALLVLDNLEQIPDFGTFISELAEQNPDLAFLATSRVALHLRGEREIALTPFLTLSGAEAPTAIARSPAVELFVSRAQATDSGFQLSDRNAPAVAEICQRLDGLPLAIELAAARVRMLPPEAMVPRLAKSLDLLTTGPRDAHPRQQTLRNTIRWSYDLLPPETQDVFRRLSVFSGDFDLSAAETVAGSVHDAFEHLSALLDHNLLVRLDADNELRFVLLDTIREFAADLIGEGEMSAARDRHARYFLDLIDIGVDRPAQVVEWLDLVEREMGNVRDALTWLESRGEASLLRQLANLLTHWWLTRGSVTEGNEWLRRADAVVGDVPVAVQILSDLNLGWMSAQTGEFESANLVLNRISPHELEKQRFKLRSTYQMARGALAFYEKDFDTAFAYIDHARQMAEQEGETARNPSIRINLGAIARARGDFDESRAQHLLGLRESTEIGINAMHTGALAEIEVHVGNYEAAWEHLQATWRDSRTLGHMLIMISAMASKVELLLNVGHPETAARLMGAADQLRLTRGWSISTYSEPEYFGLLDACKAALSPEAYESAMAAGRQLQLVEIDSLMEADPFTAPIAREVSTDALAGGRWALTARELDVLRLLVEGKTNPEIAGDLFISERTVQSHVARILQKLDVPSRSAAAAVAVRQQIIS